MTAGCGLPSLGICGLIYTSQVDQSLSKVTGVGYDWRTARDDGEGTFENLMAN